MTVVSPVRRIDAKTIRALVEKAGLGPIRDHLFPVIASGPVSNDKTPGDQTSTARIVRDTMCALGISNARIIEHEGCYPAVYGEINSDLPNAPTILIGGHYDGQPSVASQWDATKPHEPKIIPVGGGETRIFGRGTSDDWGQVLTHLFAVKMIRDSGAQLPVNLKFLIEGGEEVGSPKMDEFIRAHKEMLACDLVILTDSAPGRMDFPVITTTARGLVGAMVELKTGINNPHSGDNLTPGALEILAKVLSLKNLKTMRVEIPGFYDDVLQLSDAELGKLNAMPLDADFYLRKYGLSSISVLEGHTPQETVWAQPSYEWHTALGATKEGFPISNTISTSAIAFVTMRIVANQDPKRIFELFKAEVYRRLKEHTNVRQEELSISTESPAYPFKADVSGPHFQAVAKGMSEGFGVREVDFGGCGGTEPIAIYYQGILGVPVVFNAYNSPADNYHGNNESFSFERGFQPGVVANVLIYQNLYNLKNAVRP